MPIKDRFDNYERKSNRTKKRYLMPTYSKNDIYLYYKKSNNIKHKDKSKFNINKLTFSNIMDLYNVSLIELFKTGCIVEFPNRLGGMHLVKKKLNTLSPSSKNRCKGKLDEFVWFPIFHWMKRNTHQKANTRNIKLYSFLPTKQIREELIDLFDNGDLTKKLFTAR